MTGAPQLTPLTDAQRMRFGWLDNPTLKKVVAALEAASPQSARFVGGCVRDSLLGATPKDFDIATPLTPEAVTTAAGAAGLRAAPTGIEHGTVTVIADHVGVEVTTLRADVSTDGRRATVAFTEDWEVDARRRDFCINAIYLTPDGFLFDPVGGVVDAAASRVRFIGEARQRIREDYLRILRFFRFSARFAASFDEAGLAACASERGGIGQLSAERIGAEFSQILELPTATIAVDAMLGAEILREIWPADADPETFRRLKEIAPAAAAPVGLAALFGDDAIGIAARLRLSNADGARLRRSLLAAGEITSEMSAKDARVLAYRDGAEAFLDGAALALASQQIAQPTYEALSAVGREWHAPTFPVSGKDVVAAGIAPGPLVSKILKAAENKWIGEDFPPAARAREILAGEVDSAKSY